MYLVTILQNMLEVCHCILYALPFLKVPHFINFLRAEGACECIPHPFRATGYPILLISQGNSPVNLIIRDRCLNIKAFTLDHSARQKLQGFAMTSKSSISKQRVFNGKSAMWLWHCWNNAIPEDLPPDFT